MVWNSRWNQSLLCETVYQFIADLMSRHYTSVCPFTSSGLKMEKMLWWRGFRGRYKCQTLYDRVVGREETFWAVELLFRQTCLKKKEMLKTKHKPSGNILCLLTLMWIPAAPLHSNQIIHPMKHSITPPLHLSSALNNIIAPSIKYSLFIFKSCRLSLCIDFTASCLLIQTLMK